MPRRPLALSVLLVAALVLPTTTPGTAQAADDPAWLVRTNETRLANGLPPAVAEPAWSAGIAAHLRYLELTPSELRTGQYANGHTENPQSPYYTQEGEAAGRSSNLGGGRTDVEAIDGWLTAPFHAIGMLRPGLQRVGFHRASNGGAGQDVLRGLVHGVRHDRPVLFPGPGQTTDLVRFRGESPNPLEPCGYERSGLPLIALLTEAPTADLRAELTHPDGTTTRGPSAALCVVTEHTWRSSDGVYGSTGGSLLRSDRAVFVIPPRTLATGSHTVRLLQTGRPDVTWSFRAERPAPRLSVELARVDCGVARPDDRSWVQVNARVEDDMSSDEATAPLNRKVAADIAGQAVSLTFEAISGSASYGVGGMLSAASSPRALPAGRTEVPARLLDDAGREVARTTATLPACPSTPTRLLLTDAEVAAPAGGTATVRARLTQTGSGEGLPDHVVVLDTRPDAGTAWTESGTTTTRGDGSLAVRVPSGSEYRLRSATTPAGDSATSETGRVQVRDTAVRPTIALDRERIAFGQAATVTLTGTPGAPVELHSRLFPSTAFTRIRSGLVFDDQGRVTVVTRPNHNLRLMARDPETGLESGQPLVQVAKHLTLAARRVAPRRYTLSGAARPAHPGQTVDLYREGRLLRRGLPVDRTGRWETTLTLPAGTATYEVRSPSTGYNVASATARRLAVS